MLDIKDNFNNGFTIIETLVAIILLGMVSTMSIVVFNQLWGKSIYEKEAFIVQARNNH